MIVNIGSGNSLVSSGIKPLLIIEPMLTSIYVSMHLASLGHYEIKQPFSLKALFNFQSNIDGLVQDSSNSSALAMELLQSCTKPSICSGLE